MTDLKEIEGPRVSGTPEYRTAAEKIARKVGAIAGWKAHIEENPVHSHWRDRTMFNVVADHTGVAAEAERRLVIAGAHLDTVRTSPGGNDDGTGSASLLALARSIGDSKTDHDVRLVWFDGEENGLLGSNAYVQAHMAEMPRVKTMVESEMLGSPHGAPILLFGGRTPTDAAQPFVDAAKGLSVNLDVATERPYGSDHNSFADAGVPAMVLSSTAPIGSDPEQRILHDDPAYHSSNDTSAHLNTQLFGSLSDVLTNGVRSAAHATSGE
jgi:aminopeptidase S